MSRTPPSPRFQDVVEAVESLPPDDQALLVQIIRRRLLEQRRARLVEEVREARDAYRRGEFRRGTVDDLMKELEE
ncbi:MAG: hypothetical protein FJ279_09155 [Planctomycetes bacterium]|nr:hypothetical protein [Planctomycetota bacterium]MBM4081415.1 hypothetical protein [Planctomycetota bacterium]MBM4085199.1 hypothetical protein [Planctomycetota bacterium]